MDEETLISLAIDRAQRSRYQDLPKDSKKRNRVLHKLNHTPPLDSRRTEWFSNFSKALKSVHVEPTAEVYLLSSAREIDGRTMTFQEAIEATLRAGWGTIIGVSPSLAIYYGEEGERGAVIRKEA
jgi:hypothetical protein